MTYVVLSKPSCPSCIHAKALLERKGIDYRIEEHTTPDQIDAFVAQGHRTFPRIFDDGTLIGGFEDLVEYLDV